MPNPNDELPLAEDLARAREVFLKAWFYPEGERAEKEHALARALVTVLNDPAHTQLEVESICRVLLGAVAAVIAKSIDVNPQLADLAEMACNTVLKRSLAQLMKMQPQIIQPPSGVLPQ